MPESQEVARGQSEGKAQESKPHIVFAARLLAEEQARTDLLTDLVLQYQALAQRAYDRLDYGDSEIEAGFDEAEQKLRALGINEWRRVND